jgi:hypothetical protein
VSRAVVYSRRLVTDTKQLWLETYEAVGSRHHGCSEGLAVLYGFLRTGC